MSQKKEGVLIPSVNEPSVKAAATAQWDSRYAGAVPHDTSYYLKCVLGGAISCGSTHLAVTPLDVTKCNMQVNPGKYTGLVSGMKLIMKEEGASAIVKGWAPTFLGYSAQGMFKFGLYEYFKDFYSNLAGEEASKKYKGIIWLAGSASAEFFADIALCPMEMVKVKIQTSVAGSWPVEFIPATKLMIEKSAETRYPFGSVVPLWSRQIPYTMAKFFFFEKVVQLFYTHVFTAPKESYSKPTQLGVTFASGYIAGIVCAIVSHPADTVVSLMGKPANRGKALGEIAKDFGYANLMTKGLGVRVVMIGTLTGLQWWIYDTFKSAMGMGTTGGK